MMGKELCYRKCATEKPELQMYSDADWAAAATKIM